MTLVVASLTLLSVPQFFLECSAILVEEPGHVRAGSGEGSDVHVPFYPAHPTYARLGSYLAELPASP